MSRRVPLEVGAQRRRAQFTPADPVPAIPRSPSFLAGGSDAMADPLLLGSRGRRGVFPKGSATGTRVGRHLNEEHSSSTTWISSASTPSRRDANSKQHEQAPST